MDPRSDINLCNCFASRQAARYLTRHYESHLASVALTSTQFTILVLLNEQPGIGMRDLAEAIVMDRTSLVRALKPLQRDGLVQTGPGRTDARQNTLSLTPAGLERLSLASPLWQQAQREFEQAFGPERAEMVRDLLFQIGRHG
ncbi:MAG TPA: MarR family winged helix-turn-helix transcriptional regulator [Dyella sp.]|uniref:MarR family winged helix-turn-helix transcriptional regulator n=1 Tax=Dyella sp. TaxID=1869338 RepID=UPI002F949627